MKIRRLVIAVFLVSVLFPTAVHCQNLSVNELFSLCRKTNWDQVNEYMLAKGWEYYQSSKGDDTHYNTIVWSFKKNPYNQKAQGWFHLYTYEGLPNKIAYSFFNKPSYTTIRNGISGYGLKLVSNSIEDDEIITRYSGADYMVTLSTSKRENEDGLYSEANSMTAYSVGVIKKAGVYDKDNGLKKVYDEAGNLESEFTLKDGKMNGVAKAYYASGQLKVTANVVDGKRQGLSKEYDEDGNLSAEYIYKNDQRNGPYKIYENGNVKLTGSLLNGEKDGVFKEYDSDGKLSVEYSMKAGLLQGSCTEYYYYEKLVIKILGTYDKDQKTGVWQTLRVEKDKSRTIAFTTYLDDEKHGPFKEIKSDSILVGTYNNGELDGEIKIYRSSFASLFGYIDGDTAKSQLVTVGSYRNGNRDGYWKYYTMKGQLSEEGTYYNELKSGAWKYYLPSFLDQKGNLSAFSGKLFMIETYKDGRKDGKQTIYGYLDRSPVACATDKAIDTDNLVLSDTCYQYFYRNSFRTAYYKSDQLHGPFEQKDSVGTLIAKGNFLNGKKDGLWTESFVRTKKDGKQFYVFLRGTYRGGLEEGTWEEFKDDGYVYIAYTYEAGELNGKTTSYSRDKKPLKDAYYQNGFLQKLDLYDSTANNLFTSYEILNESIQNFKCRKTEFNPDGKSEQVYTVLKAKPERITPGSFLLLYASLISAGSQAATAFEDGQFKRYDSKGNILEEGNMTKQQKTGLWKYYHYDINVVVEQNTGSVSGEPEKYLLITTGQAFSGTFVQKSANGKPSCEIKIEEGYREGKSKYFTESGKLARTEKYKKGIKED